MIRSELYADQRLVIDTDDSTFVGDRVFTGNQPDDCALAGLLGPAPRVLMLGLGLGAGIRPVLAAAPQAAITAVELNRPTADLAQLLFGCYFPDLKFATVVGDALAPPQDTVDVLVVDIYGADGTYPRGVLEQAFWGRLATSLAPGGILIVNSWGLPGHLAPLTPPSPQAAVAQELASALPWVVALDGRRNVTFVGGHTPLEPVLASPGGLKPPDEAGLRTLGRRLASAPLVAPDPTGAPADWSGDAIQKEMADRWGPAMAEAAAALDKDGLPPLDRHVLTDPALGPAVLECLLAREERLAALIPAGCFELAMEGLRGAQWYGEWVLQHLDEPIASSWMSRIGIPQALAQVHHPRVPAPEWGEDLVAAILQEGN